MKPSKRESGAGEINRQIRLEMARRRMLTRDLAQEIGYGERYVTNVIQGFKKTKAVRIAIEQILGVPFWTQKSMNSPANNTE
jgi:hypothetical protein